MDTWLPSLLVFFGSLPYFWLAMAALYLFGFQLGWFPLGHAYSDDAVPGWTLGFAADVLRHAALPMLTIVLATLGGWLLSSLAPRTSKRKARRRNASGRKRHSAALPG